MCQEDEGRAIFDWNKLTFEATQDGEHLEKQGCFLKRKEYQRSKRRCHWFQWRWHSHDAKLKGDWWRSTVRWNIDGQNTAFDDLE